MASVLKFDQWQSTAGVAKQTILQAVQTIKTDIWTTTSTSFVDVTGLNCTITPSSTTSRIMVFVSLCGMSAQDHSYYRIVRNISGGSDVNIGTGVADQGSSPAASGGSFYRYGTSGQHQCTTMVIDSPATTSAITYRIQAYHYSAYTFRLGWGNGDSSTNGARTAQIIQLLEIAG